MRISLGKNSAAFVRLPNTDLFGLIEWYGKKAGKPGRKAAADPGAIPVIDIDEEETPDNGDEQDKAA